MTKDDRGEAARLDALHQLNLLDTPASESFDRITRMAAQIFGLPIAAVSLTDRDRQWFKSRVGITHQSLPREKAPCAQVAETATMVVIPDLHADACYRSSPLVDQGIRFYAGAPLVTREGFSLGALCVLGTEPRTASDAELAALSDLAAMVMSQIELQHAFGRIDSTSGLPNRLQFFDDCDDLGRDASGQPRLAVLVDIVRQEQLNTSVRALGAGFIDDVVTEAVRVLRGVLGTDRALYHVGATQFLFLAPPGVDQEAYVAALPPQMAAVRDRSPARFAFAAAVGIAPFVTGLMSPRDVLRTAHNAVQDAWASDRSISVYSTASDQVHRRRFQIRSDFPAALHAPDQLRVVFQPRISLTSGRCIGAEALLRWRHPRLGEISPAEFIPVIEQTEMARALTEWVLDTALGQLARWRGTGPDLVLSINVSAANLEESDFAARVQLYQLKHGIDPDALELEVTESAVMGNERNALAQLHALQEAGIRLAIDDFGTGYSSLAYLQRLPAQVVKIDRSFVSAMADGERERSLVRSMITLSQQLDYHVVAEGVETAAAAAMLADMGCNEAQGFFYAMPLDPPEFARWFRDQLPSAVATQAA